MKIEDIIEPEFSELAVLKQQVDGKNELHHPHTHDFYLILLIDNGEGIHHIDAEAYAVKDRRIFFVAPGQTHSWDMKKDTTGYQLFFKAGFITNQILLSEWPMFKPGSSPFIDTSVEEFVVLTHEIIQLQQEITEKQVFNARILNYRLAIILTLLSRSYSLQWHNIEVLSAPHRLVEKFKELLENDYQRAGHVQYYADRLFVTPSYLNTVTKKVLGQHAGNLIRERRLLEAKRMLAITTMDMQEIAFALGYNKLAYFSHFFKRHVGVSPSTFRSTGL